MKDHSAKLKIIQLLSSGNSVSGEVLGKELGVSRAAISKQVKSLADWGLDVYSLPGKGYQLANQIELLDNQILTPLIQMPSDVTLFPHIDSTNQYMMGRLDKWDSGDVCLAEYQTAGRGRRGRKWVSPYGSNLYMSMYWRFEEGVAATMGLSLIVGIAIAETLNQHGVSSSLKWPNDVYIEGRKVSGVLVELAIEAGGAAQVVIGIGINLRMNDQSSQAEAIDQPWTSLEQHLNSPVKRNQFAAALINRLHDELNQYQLTGNQGIAERWQKYDHFIDQPVRLIMGKQTIEGVARGIDDTGAILVESDNVVTPYIGGEISLRGN
ncbi:bifunctional biotin--[acetyl-CoA-carboxylase] ligase/biotin operon repressor BirA [Vibrio ulleungensis]|uniref:Bifunctional ligase/repressor BirA n=1 Tax=Vibrio ulleungensis TaxID=2807619 RepID=A0ABS2HQZ5_9VIBR|nr:bifunctional biotin--[acetyl-CoA-carboxylase] ligase/biotin operon repressor BirA [Vibrio ulleungensis]MBM7038307.1 bifunctional biotin--[acetyl-CoA-carboxylase] ligase/biotin operon repressor BirA [Vibrio ulleungensis]